MPLPDGLINLDHYTSAAQAMIEMEQHKAQMDASRQVSQKVNMLGHGGALRKKIADFAGVRDDVRGSAAHKRKRTDAHDFRNDLILCKGWVLQRCIFAFFISSISQGADAKHPNNYARD